jgi:hypothetical protein
MSIWEFNMPIKQHNLIGPQYIGISEEVLQNITNGGGGGGYERMLLDSMIVCILFIGPQYLAVSQEVGLE